MNIYFHIDELKRDAIVASALKKKFRALGHNIVYGNRITGPILKLFHNAFDIIVFPRPHFIHDMLGDDSLNWDQEIVMLSSESLGIICKDYEVMARTLLEDNYFNDDTKYIDKIAAFCLWGARQKKAIEMFAPDVLKKCSIVGHPRHDGSSLKNSQKKQTKTRNIGFVTRANGLNDYYGRMAIEGFEVLFDDHFQYEYINKKTGKKLKSNRNVAQPRNNLIVQSYDTENMLKIMKAFDGKDCKLFVRCHPKENLDVWRYLFKKCSIDIEVSDSFIPITHWLEGIDVVIGPPSTTFYDAAIEETRCISIINLDKNRLNYIGELWEENNELMKDISAPQTIQEILDDAMMDKDFTLTASLKETLMREADYPECRNSLDKFVNICIDINMHKSFKKTRNINLFLYKTVSFIYQKMWSVKSFIIQRDENSSMYTFKKSTLNFIDNLTR